jgi:HK97 family phage major capsid protein
MATTKEFLKGLVEQRETALHAMQETRGEIEAHGADVPAEVQQRWDAQSAEVIELGKRIDGLLALEEQSRDLEQQRERFAPMLEKSTQRESQAIDQRVVAWAKGGLPDASEWAPKSIEVNVGDFLRENGIERHDLLKTTGAAGGNLVGSTFIRELLRIETEQSAVRQTNARTFNTDSGETMLIPKVATTGAAVIVAEGAAIPESDPTFGQEAFGAYKFANLMQVSRELLEDSGIDLAAELGAIAGQQIADGEGPYLVTGTGTAQPEGVVTGNVLGFQGSTLAAINYGQLVDLFTSVRGGYRRNGYWLMNDVTLAALWKIVGSDGQPILRESANGAFGNTLLGRPVVTDPNMPTSGAQAAVILFGDFGRYYGIRDVNGVRFERSDDYAFANDLVTFRVIHRMDARHLVDDGAGSAVKALRLT